MAPHYITMVSRIGCTRAGPKEEEQQELFGDAGRDGYLQQRIHRRRGLADLGLKKRGRGKKHQTPWFRKCQNIIVPGKITVLGSSTFRQEIRGIAGFEMVSKAMMVAGRSVKIYEEI
jgi:hypothetical protein